MNDHMSPQQKIVKQALSFQTPDRLPIFEGYIWQDFIDKWRKERNIPDNETFEDRFPCDLCTLRPIEHFFPSRIRQISNDGNYIFRDDGWGRIVKEHVHGNFSEPVERMLSNPSELDKIEFESTNMDSRYASMADKARLNREKGKAVFVNTGGPFIRSSFIRGETEFLMDMVMDETFATELVNRVGEHLMQVGLEALKRTSAEDFGIWIYDDMCSTKGPMFSPAIFERIFLPVYKRMVTSYKAAGAKWVILHCDGNLRPFLDMLIEAGIDGINPVEFAAGMNVAELMEKYHGKLSFIGGVCNTQIMTCNDLARIRQHVEMVANAGRHGGLVAGTHSVGNDISVQSYELYRQILAEKGKYRD